MHFSLITVLAISDILVLAILVPIVIDGSSDSRVAYGCNKYV